MSIFIVDAFIDRIPCQAEVETYRAERQTWTDPGYPAGWDLCRVLDRKGYNAPWLERKLVDKRIEQAFFETVDDQLVALSQSEY